MKHVQKNLNTPDSAELSLAVRKVSIAKKKGHHMLLSLVFISFFSLSFCIGYVGTFLLFK